MNLSKFPEDIIKYIIRFNGNNNLFSTINKQWYNMYITQFEIKTSIDKINIMSNELIKFITIDNFDKKLRKLNTSICDFCVTTNNIIKLKYFYTKGFSLSNQAYNYALKSKDFNMVKFIYEYDSYKNCNEINFDKSLQNEKKLCKEFIEAHIW